MEHGQMTYIVLHLAIGENFENGNMRIGVKIVKIEIYFLEVGKTYNLITSIANNN